MWTIEIKRKENTEGKDLKKAILDLNIGINQKRGKGKIENCEVIHLYYILGQILRGDAEKIAQKLLADNIVETYKILPEPLNTRTKQKPVNCHKIEVAYKPGVMDPVTESALKAIKDMNINGVSDVKTGTKYLLYGKLEPKELDLITNKLLLNRTIQRTIKFPNEVELPNPTYDFRLLTIDLLNAGPAQLARICSQYTFTIAEIAAIQRYFKSIGRNPTDIEIETIAQTWSEHCIHKTFKSNISFNGAIVQPLFSMIKEVTDSLNPDWCVSVFEDNAGIIKFTRDYNICFKVETHNHPSAIEPYGGAGTGIGGVIRDILGTGLGAKPVVNTDVFCFGTPNYPQENLPQGTLHPLRIMKGVISGVRDYGNRMGIPTTNGAVLFDDRYTGNPLVYCGTVGLIPDNSCKKSVVAGDLIVLLGGKTGRDGIHGVTFASVELNEKSEEISSGAVQIGNPITEKKVTDALLKARDLGLYRAITDCGGGGLSSAIGELAQSHGAEVDLDKIPLKYSGLSYREIWISEAQERMIIFVPNSKLEKLKEVCKEEAVEVSVIGKVTNNKILYLKYNEQEVASLDMEFLHKGIPLSTKEAKWAKPKGVKYEEFKKPSPPNLTPSLLKILAEWNVCSKEWIIRQYDHEVQGGAVCKPLMENGAPGDSCVARPVLNSEKGVVVGCGINPKYGEIDPYWMAASAVDEAIRNLVAVGANPDKIALLDNFCWGNPDKPEVLGTLTKAVQGCCDIAKAYKTPFISGKDSLYNEYKAGNKAISIPGTLLISAIGTIDDVNKTVSSNLKSAGNSIYIIGETWDELGGSHYYAINNLIGSKVPTVRPNLSVLQKLYQAIQNNLISSCHDCSEGGIAVACAEMCFGGEIGIKIRLDKVLCGEKIIRNDTLLFSESNTRFIVEVEKGLEQKFEKLMDGCKFSKIGISTKTPEMEVLGLKGKAVIKSNIGKLKKEWSLPLGKYRTLAPEQRISNFKPPAASPKYKTVTIKHRPRVLVLRTAGTNCDVESAYAFEKAGAKPDFVHINQIVNKKHKLKDYEILVLPGGFSYGDDVSAGKILANEAQYRLGKEIEEFVSGKKLVIGICNGFQILVKLGLLPYKKLGEQVVTLTNNTSGMFQCEWVRLEVPKSQCIFTKGLKEIELPIAHGEGRFVASKNVIKDLNSKKQIALYYKKYNPNGSMEDIAGICDRNGRIFGLMPHPERFIFKTQHPAWTKYKNIEPLGLIIFKNAVDYIK